MKKSPNESPMEVLTALLEERAKYESWLKGLEQKRGATPTHVFERVRSDYEARLRRVMDQLAGRATELEATATDLASRVDRLYAEETARRDERAEAELRAAVGEFGGDEADVVIVRCDGEIQRFSAERASVGAELAKIQEILTLAKRKSGDNDATVVPIESLAPMDTGRNVKQPPMAAPPPSSQNAGLRASPQTVPSFDELAFLQSVVETGTPDARRTPPQPASAGNIHASPSTPSAPPLRPRHSDIDAPPIAADPQRAAAIRKSTEPEVTQQSPLAAARRGAAPTPVLTSPPLVENEEHENARQATLSPGSMPAFLKDMPTEQIKTLKCQECGTMNYPTEWYCERCGGELAAL